MVVIEHFPPYLVRALPEIALLLVGVFIERHYISRVAVFSNATALAVHYLSIQPVSGLYTLYVEIGIVLGIYGFVQYLREVSIGQAYYVTMFYLYSSLSIGAIIFLPIHPFWSFVIATIAQMAMVVAKGSVSEWAYAGPRPADIQWFIDNKVISYPNYRIGKRVEVPLSDIFD